MKVYVLTAGDYSDYHIVGVFSTKEKAQEFKKLFPAEWNDEYYDDDYDGIKEYDLDYNGRYQGMIDNGLHQYDAVMNVETEKGRASLTDVEQLLTDNGFNGVYDGWIYKRVWAKDKDHAIKILSELRRETLAEYVPAPIPPPPPTPALDTFNVDMKEKLSR